MPCDVLASARQLLTRAPLLATIPRNVLSRATHPVTSELSIVTIPEPPLPLQVQSRMREPLPAITPWTVLPAARRDSSCTLDALERLTPAPVQPLTMPLRTRMLEIAFGAVIPSLLVAVIVNPPKSIVTL